MADIERHPFEPFLPGNAEVLFLGSFPPGRERWSIDFFYPNWINDFWRVLGLLFHADRTWFETKGEKRFDRDRIVTFCTERGIALFDTALAVRRLKDNASDAYLEVVEATDVRALLSRLPRCRALACTGGKATAMLSESFGCPVPPLGESIPLPEGALPGQAVRFFRMPSTSRAYPLPLERKAEAYASLFRFLGML